MDIQLLRLQLGGRMSRLKYKRMQTEGKWEGLCQCERLHITFLNLVPSP